MSVLNAALTECFFSSTFLQSPNMYLLCNYSCTKSCLVFPLLSLPCFYPQPGWIHTQLLSFSFYSKWGATLSPQPFNHTGPKKKTLLGWQEMWMEFPHQTAGKEMVFVYCEGRSEDLGEGEEGKASFTPECQSWFLREECGQDQRVSVCTPELWGTNGRIQTRNKEQFVYCCCFLCRGREWLQNRRTEEMY